jgi:hypothetical protein
MQEHRCEESRLELPVNPSIRFIYYSKEFHTRAGSLVMSTFYTFESGLQGDWQLEEGWQIDEEAGNHYLSGTGIRSALLETGQIWSDFFLQCMFRVLHGSIGISFRVGPVSKYLLVIGKKGVTLLKHSPAGISKMIENGNTNHAEGLWHDLGILAQGDSFRIFIGGNLELEGRDNSPLLNGTIAFDCIDDAHVNVDDVRVTHMPGKNLPDLVIRLWNDPQSTIRWISPWPPIAWQLSDISVLVKNAGTAPVNDPFETELYIDGKQEKIWNFEPFNTKEGMSLPLYPDRSLLYSHTVMLPAGKHTFLWVVDPKGTVKEADESGTSNRLEAIASWYGAEDLPDLAVEDIGTENPPVALQETTWTITIKNRGKVAADTPFLTTLSADKVQFGAFWLDRLDPEQMKTFKTTQWEAKVGSVKVMGVVDAGHMVSDRDWSNNTLERSFDVQPRILPDLEVENLKIAPMEPSVCEDFVISFQVRNNGPATVSIPFKIRVTPGEVNNGATVPVSLQFPKSRIPLQKGTSVPMEHQASLLYPADYDVYVDIDPEGTISELDRGNNTAFLGKVKVYGMYKSRTNDLRNPPPASRLKCYIERDPSLPWFRKKVALTAIDEIINFPNLCGDQARDRYDAGGSWCSEFVRWVLIRAGMRNISYCSAYFLFCWNRVYLDEVSLNKELVKLFDRNGNRFRWRDQINPQTAEVGDYVSMETGGKRKNHAGIIVGVTDDNKYLITVEGNVGNCLSFGWEPYFDDGKTLNPDIDGIGKIDAGLF